MARTPITANSATGLAFSPAPLVRARPRSRICCSGQPFTPASEVEIHLTSRAASTTVATLGEANRSSQATSASAPSLENAASAGP